MTPEILLFVLALVGAGLFAGVIAGLFGVGGGAVIVPALFYLLGAFGYGDDVRTHVAVATSLSTIVTTSWRSLAAHAKHGAVDETILKTWAPWIALGAAAGAVLAGAIDGRSLALVFGVGLLLIAVHMGVGREDWRLAQAMPTGWPRRLLGGAIGALSAMIGVGGGSFGVTLMTLCNQPIHRAVATASGFGAAIAIPATLANVWTGWGEVGLPPLSLGYVNLPGFVVLGLLTGLAAPLGARLAHRLDRRKLRLAFAVFLAATSLKMLWDAARF